MNFFDVMMSFDSRTMLGILFWCNFFLTAMVFSFESTIKIMQDREYIHRAVLIRLAYSAAYLLLFLSEILPHAISVNGGYSLLFVSFYLDAGFMLSFLSVADKRRRQNILKFMLAAGIIVFNALDIALNNNIIRTVVSSYIILSMFTVTTVSFMRQKNISRFKRVVGGFYVLFLISLSPRIVIPMTELGASPYANAIAESGFYLVLHIITVCGIMTTLLCIKERSDIVLENMALNDQLTQIPNRHCFFLKAEPLFLKCQREKRELSILFTDIDYFKKINDSYGHDFGDIVLKRFGVVIKENVRPYDLICRYGGEEFLMMLECDKPDVAENLALRIMERLKSEKFDEVPDFKFTISVGINAGVPDDGDTLDGYINNADAALYEAKNSGRNTIRFYRM